MPVIYFPAPCFIVLCGCWASSKYLRDIFLNSIFSFHVSVSYLGILKIFQMVPLFCVRYGDLWGFPSGSVVKNAPVNAGDTGDMGSIPGLGRFPGEGNGNRLQYSCLRNPMDRGAWWLQPMSQALRNNRAPTQW